jgi:hypothetical protein
VATLIGVSFLFLLLVGVLSALRLGGTSGERWDLMSAYQRRELLKERHAANPRLRVRP